MNVELYCNYKNHASGCPINNTGAILVSYYLGHQLICTCEAWKYNKRLERRTKSAIRISKKRLI
jgi:hypothetical protein